MIIFIGGILDDRQGRWNYHLMDISEHPVFQKQKLSRGIGGDELHHCESVGMRDIMNLMGFSEIFPAKAQKKDQMFSYDGYPQDKSDDPSA